MGRSTRAIRSFQTNLSLHDRFAPARYPLLASNPPRFRVPHVRFFCLGLGFPFSVNSVFFSLCTLCYRPSSVLRIGTDAARRPALFPQLFPIPDPARHLIRQRKSELMREHTHLSAMMGFVRNHVAQHFHANRPRLSPTVSEKLPNAATVERFPQHLRAASGALRQSRAGLPRRA